ncbi:MAG: sirohydrochlorin chelatase [Spirochaetia bacterium]|nr:sirohydrochlorin chelatase [Spirochaetia bacterium]
MRYILFIGHGSRDERGNEEIRAFVKNIVQKTNISIFEVCFLEFGAPDIPAGINNCILAGATEIVVIPVILLAAGHSKLHIPSALDQAREKYPHVKFHYSTPVGSDARILDIMDDRMKSVWDMSIMPEQETAVLLVGRGSSDPDANSTLFRIARLFWERHKFEMVETAFMGITRPLMMDGLVRCRNLGARNIVVLPYFLFTGILMERMKSMISGYAASNPDVHISLADYFGFHPYLEDIVVQKIKDVHSGGSAINCDFCLYRLHGQQHHHHH